jgi:hypothetical protein
MESLPICAHVSSVKLPINCGVALTPSLSVSSSTILPMLYQRADLRRCFWKPRVSTALDMNYGNRRTTIHAMLEKLILFPEEMRRASQRRALGIVIIAVI